MTVKRACLLCLLLLLLSVGWLALRPQPAAAVATPLTPAKRQDKTNTGELVQMYDQLLSAPRGQGNEMLPFKSKGRVRLKPGESAILGFWKISGDKNGLAIITPTIMPNGMVATSTRLLQVSDAVVQDQAVRDLFPSPFELEQYGAMGQEAVQAALRYLSSAKGADMMSAPSVTTRTGQRASISVGQEGADGEMKKGIMLDLQNTPVDEGGLELSLQLELR